MLDIQKFLEGFETWCRRRIEKISWTDRVRNEEVLHRVKEERNILHSINRAWLDWSHLGLKLFLKYVIEGKIEEGIEVPKR
jgi:hypothetical protein